MFRVIYIVLSLLSGAFVLPLLIFTQIKYKQKVIAKYIIFFSNFYLFLITFGTFRIYDETSQVMNLFVFLLFFLSYILLNFTAPLFFNSLFKFKYSKLYTQASILIVIVLFFSINNFQKMNEVRLADIMILFSFVYCLIISISNYKKLRSNIEKKIGLASIIFVSILVIEVVLQETFFLVSFLSFFIMNTLSIIMLCYFIKFSSNNLDVEVDIVKSFNLTSREHEVFLLLKKGLTYKEISNDLSISVATVKTHLNKVYKKTNTKSRFELTAKY